MPKLAQLLAAGSLSIFLHFLARLACLGQVKHQWILGKEAEEAESQSEGLVSWKAAPR